MQLVLGHAQLTTTQIYLTPRNEDVIRRVLAHHADQSRRRATGSCPGAGLPARDAGRAVRDGPAMTGTVAVAANPGGRAAQVAPARTRQPGWRSRFPARPVAESWPAAGQDRARVLALVASASAGLPESRIHANHAARPAGTAGLAGRAARPDLAAAVAGQRRRHRRRAVGGRARPGGCGAAACTRASRLELMTSSLLVLVGADVIRPSLAWLLTGGKKRKLARNMICSRDPGGFARLRQFCRDDPAITPAAAGQGRCSAAR